ncbi:MAG: HigA family addiction module antitoxin [Thermoguttaceae bacterium]
MDTTRRMPAEVFPPGEFIREELEARGWTQADLAAILNKPLPAVNEIIAGKKAITPETANSLGDAFGVGPEFWLNLENAYRLSLAGPSDADVAKRAQLYSVAPIKDLIRRGWIRQPNNVQELETNVLAFYRVAALNDIESHQGRIAARKSSPYDSTPPSELAWYCRVLQMAELLQVSSYSEQVMRIEGLAELHRLTSSEQEVREVPRVLADFGVRFVIADRLPKMQVDGVAFWVGDSPAIAVTLRADRIDGFWFTLAHELAHILHRDRTALDTNLVGKDRQPTDEKPEIEKKADQFASDFLIPQAEIDRFILRVRPLYSKVGIIQFANRIGVHPGIVVGQLQHRREIGWSHSREMLVKVREELAATAYVDGWGSEPTE